MENVIQFIANYGNWVAIKKLKITPETDSKIVMEFLASLEMGIDRKVEENLRKIVDLEKVDKVLDELVSAGRSADNVAKTIAAVSGPKISRVVNEICDLDGLQKNEKTELADFCKVYAMRKALKECKLAVDYCGIKIPGMKKPKKPKAK